MTLPDAWYEPPDEDDEHEEYEELDDHDRAELRLMSYDYESWMRL